VPRGSIEAERKRLQMTEGRPLGVKLIAAYLFLKATALVLAVAVISKKPEYGQGAKEFILNFDLHLESPIVDQ
jgi:hypothetical protein